MMQIDAVLWDLDGVLTDSGDIHYHTWIEIFKPYNIPFSPTDFRHVFGMNNATMLGLYFDPVREAETIHKVGEAKEVLFRKLAHGQLQPFPGVLDWLSYFQAHGVRQAVASSAPAENIEVMIAELGIRAYFEALVSGAKIPGKPAPDVFLLAAKTLGVPANRCLVVEDSVAGVEAACQAGMKSVAVLNTSPASALHKASLVVEQLSDLDPASLGSLL